MSTVRCPRVSGTLTSPCRTIALSTSSQDYMQRWHGPHDNVLDSTYHVKPTDLVGRLPINERGPSARFAVGGIDPKTEQSGHLVLVLRTTQAGEKVPSKLQVRLLHQSLMVCLRASQPALPLGLSFGATLKLWPSSLASRTVGECRRCRWPEYLLSTAAKE